MSHEKVVHSLNFMKAKILKKYVCKTQLDKLFLLCQARRSPSSTANFTFHGLLQKDYNGILLMGFNFPVTNTTLAKILNGTVSIISSDPPCKDDNARFTKVSLKP